MTRAVDGTPLNGAERPFGILLVVFGIVMAVMTTAGLALSSRPSDSCETLGETDNSRAGFVTLVDYATIPVPIGLNCTWRSDDGDTAAVFYPNLGANVGIYGGALSVIVGLTAIHRNRKRREAILTADVRRELALDDNLEPAD